MPLENQDHFHFATKVCNDKTGQKLQTLEDVARDFVDRFGVDLIKTDTELGKVTWPKITPWFKSESLVWGSTYVVLIVVVALTVYVFGVDLVLQWISQKLFYGTSRGGL